MLVIKCKLDAKREQELPYADKTTFLSSSCYRADRMMLISM